MCNGLQVPPTRVTASDRKTVPQARHHTGAHTMAVSRLYSWYVLALLLACCSAAKSTLKDLKVKRRRRTQAAGGRRRQENADASYGTSGGYSYGEDGSSYSSGGNAINNLFGDSYGDGTKTSYSYSYGDDTGFSSCQVDPNNASTAGFLCSDGRTCVEGAKSCDSNPDCPDHSDELG